MTTTSDVNETIYAGRDNVFSLQLVRGGEPVNLMSIIRYELFVGEDLSFASDTYTGMFVEKDNGVVEINIGAQLTEDDKGRYTAYLVSYDLVNTHGVRWPNFKLKVN